MDDFNVERMRREAAAKIRGHGYRDTEALNAAKSLLGTALEADPDRDGKTHHLLGLACFHLQDWDGAVTPLETAVGRDANNVAATRLLALAKTNAATRVDLPMGPACPFDTERLRRAPLLRAPERIEDLPPDRRSLVLQLAQHGFGFAFGTIVDCAARIAYVTRNRKVPFGFESWEKRGFVRGQLELAHIRRRLNRHALQSTYDGLVGHQQGGQPRPPWTKQFRTATGAWTTDDPMEGAAGTELQRSGRCPVEERRGRAEDGKLPDARLVSRLMLASRGGRETVPFLNMLTVAWIQPQLHDWLSHAPAVPREGAFQVPLAENDPLRESHGIGALYVAKSASNPLPQRGKLTYLNEVTHWWDASHLYGSDQAKQDELRQGSDGKSLPDGKMRMEDGLLPLDTTTGLEITGFGRNWWVGPSLFHTLFVKHHNFICDVLKRAHPAWSTDQLFHTARLVNAAILAKIHTVEWTPAVLANRKIAAGMAANWWGLLEALSRPFSERRIRRWYEPVHAVLGGIVAGKRNNHGKPYGLTEEFSEIYRLHAAIPDAIEVRPIGAKLPLATIPTDATRAARARTLIKEHGLATLLNSFGHQHMPALVNNNYPAFAGAMSVEGQAVIDLGTIDIIRARERGVPPYNAFRAMMDLKPVTKFEDLTPDPETVANLKALYGGDVDRIDLLVGTSCESRRPEYFGFGETMFQVFIQMASRRLQADPFYTEKFNARYYTEEGMRLIERATLKEILLQHFPELGYSLAQVDNAFEPWGTSAGAHPKEHPLSRSVDYGHRPPALLRLRDEGTGVSYIADLAANRVYAAMRGERKIARENAIQGEVARRVLRSARGYHAFSEFAAPGDWTPDGYFEVRGALTRCERDHFHEGRDIPVERPALLLHLDFFDRDDDGRITLAENYRGWRRLRFGRLASAFKALASGYLFGGIMQRLTVDIERIAAKRRPDNTGIYDKHGNLDRAYLEKYCAHFRSSNGRLTFEEVMALLRCYSTGPVSVRQFRSLFSVCRRMNRGERIVTEAQFRGLFDGSLLWKASSHIEADAQSARH